VIADWLSAVHYIRSNPTTGDHPVFVFFSNPCIIFFKYQERKCCSRQMSGKISLEGKLSCQNLCIRVAAMWQWKARHWSGGSASTATAAATLFDRAPRHRCDYWNHGTSSSPPPACSSTG